MGTTRLTIAFFWKYTKRYPLLFCVGLFNMLQTIINGVIIPLIVGFALAKLTNDNAIGLSFRQIFMLMAGLSAAGIAFNRLGLNAINNYEINATRDINNDIARHLIYESYDFHAKSFSGALISKATKLGGSYINFIDTVMIDMMRNTLIITASFVTLLFYDVRLASLLLFMAILGITVNFLMTRRRYPLQRKAISVLSDQSAYLSDMITNAPSVKTFASEQTELKAYSKINSRFSSAMIAAWNKQLDGNTATLAIAGTMNVLVLAYGVYAVKHSLIPLGVFLAANLYASRINNSFWDFGHIIRSLERIFADAHEMIEIMHQPNAMQDKPGASQLVIKKGALTFNHVTFSYNDRNADDVILSDFTLSVLPGEKIGLVGRSGGGKTTITKLALRFMDIQAGSISIDGQNIAEVTQRNLRENIAYVPQEPLLFHRSIAENIRYGDPGASHTQIKRVAKLAFVDEFVDALPNKYDTEVGERGVKLSGGQRQRVAIARAMLRNAPILVLDEATSALDSESEVSIQAALWKLMEGKTALVIAHRLSTIQKMDRIIVLDEGKIIEEGTHQQLLAKKGTYADLWKHQSGGFLED